MRSSLRIALLIGTAASVGIAMSAHADEAQFVKDAELAASAWLALVDAGQYADAWDQAAPIVQLALTKVDFEKAMKVARRPLGDLKSRKVKSATFTTTLPGVADGEYVVLQFETAFENKASAIEIVTPQRIEGKWKVSGYYIK